MTDIQKKTAGIAIASLVFGILGFICFLGPLGAIPAIICGHIAKSKIKDSAGALQGNGLALAGLILGYLGIGLMVVVVVMLPFCAGLFMPALAQARDMAQQQSCICNMKMIDLAKQQVALEHDYSKGATVPNDQISERLPNGLSGLKCPKGGSYTINSIGKEPVCSVHGALSAAISAENTRKSRFH